MTKNNTKNIKKHSNKESIDTVILSISINLKIIKKNTSNSKHKYNLITKILNFNKVNLLILKTKTSIKNNPLESNHKYPVDIKINSKIYPLIIKVDLIKESRININNLNLKVKIKNLKLSN